MGKRRVTVTIFDSGGPICYGCRLGNTTFRCMCNGLPRNSGYGREARRATQFVAKVGIDKIEDEALACRARGNGSQGRPRGDGERAESATERFQSPDEAGADMAKASAKPVGRSVYLKRMKEKRYRAGPGARVTLSHLQERVPWYGVLRLQKALANSGYCKGPTGSVFSASVTEAVMRSTHRKEIGPAKGVAGPQA
jgi:hypothetical protein